MARWFFSAWVILAAACLIVQAQNRGEKRDKIWAFENSRIFFEFGHFADDTFGLVQIRDKKSGAVWRHSRKTSSSPMRMNHWLNGDTKFSSVALTSEWSVGPRGQVETYTFIMRSPEFSGEFDFVIQVYEGQPFLRTRFGYRNMRDRDLLVREIGLLWWEFDAAGDFSALRVNQWKHEKRNFEILETNFKSDADHAKIFSGAYGEHCTWVAVKDKKSGHGLVGGWEFNGQARGVVYHNKTFGRLHIPIETATNYWLAPGERFESPSSFIGLFSGDWDEAAYRTQRFVEQALAKPMPEPDKFPYLMFDSWGYGEDINEEKLFQAAKIASELGAEVFTVDLGWAAAIGDWRPDPKKFPRGLKPLSDYVHSLGMKFGLHWPLVQARLDSPILKENPEWTSSVDHGYFGANSLCLGHQPVREWLIREGIRIIREYGVDWVLQDGENMVKVCEKTSHTHHPEGSNYANSERGLDEVIARIQAVTPDTVWENCEDGGNMMTYKMVQQYVTSILSDNIDTLQTRQGIYGGTFPFPPRYSVRYMQDPPTTFNLRSHMFGGPLILMQRITEWSEEEKQLAVRELQLYKNLRPLIRDAKVIHLLERPDGQRNDAIQAYNEQLDSSVVFIYRPNKGKSRQLIKPRGLKSEEFYRVGFQEQKWHWVMASGKNLMNQGIPVQLPAPNSAEIILIEAMNRKPR